MIKPTIRLIVRHLPGQKLRPKLLVVFLTLGLDLSIDLLSLDVVLLEPLLVSFLDFDDALRLGLCPMRLIAFQAVAILLDNDVALRHRIIQNLSQWVVLR